MLQLWLLLPIMAQMPTSLRDPLRDPCLGCHYRVSSSRQDIIQLLQQRSHPEAAPRLQQSPETSCPDAAAVWLLLPFTVQTMFIILICIYLTNSSKVSHSKGHTRRQLLARSRAQGPGALILQLWLLLHVSRQQRAQPLDLLLLECKDAAHIARGVHDRVVGNGASTVRKLRAVDGRSRE